jgi:hypothetical protein
MDKSTVRCKGWVDNHGHRTRLYLFYVKNLFVLAESSPSVQVQRKIRYVCKNLGNWTRLRILSCLEMDVMTT